MNFTNYFENINIESIKNICDSCLIKLNDAKTFNVNSVNNYWDSLNSKKLIQSVDKNNSQIEIVIQCIMDLNQMLNSAILIKNYQNQMKGTQDYSTQTSLAVKISSELKKIDELSKKNSVSVAESKVFLAFESLSNIYRCDFSSIENVKSSLFNDYSRKLVDSYKHFENVKSSISSDAYLYSQWFKTIKIFDKVIENVNKIDYWWTNYISNIKNIEKSLPEETNLSITMVEVSKNVIDHSTLKISNPNFENYRKSGITGAIVEPKKESTSQSSSNYTNPGTTVSNGSPVSSVPRSTSGTSIKVDPVKNRGVSGTSVKVDPVKNRGVSGTSIKVTPKKESNIKVDNTGNYHGSTFQGISHNKAEHNGSSHQGMSRNNSKNQNTSGKSIYDDRRTSILELVEKKAKK